MSRPVQGRPAAPEGTQQHRDWLSLVEVSGPFLSLPVLRRAWPTLDALDKKTRERLRAEHATWQDGPDAGQPAWIDYVLRDLLAWDDALVEEGLHDLTVRVAEHDADITPSFALVDPGEEVKPDSVRLLGLVCPPGQRPTARIPGESWSATPVDRLAHLCRHRNVELGLATDGRWWCLVWARKQRATATAVFDAVSWPEAAERIVVRAFVSLLCRRRFFGVPDAEKLVALFDDSKDAPEEITEALGVQVRQAVELLVGALGRADVRDRELGGRGLQDIDAHDVYRGAVAVMMRIVFVLFAEERKLLPADDPLYVSAYSAGRLCTELEQDAIDGSEEDMEHSVAAWHRLLALFDAVYDGIDHPRLLMHGHDGSLFDPKEYPWLPLNIDDRTVLHMLRAVQYVEIGSGRSRERRTLSFGTLGVEQIGYVYEGLLSYEGFRAGSVTVGLIGKEGLEEEVALTDLKALADRMVDTPGLADALAERYRDSRIGSAAALAKRLAPLDGVDREEARKRLLAVTNGDYPLAERLLPFVGIIRADLRGLPLVILPGALFVTESPLRKLTGTHYTPQDLAKETVKGALQPLVYAPGPLQTADTDQWRPKSSKEILALRVADIAMGSAAFLVAAARYLAEHLVDAWSREGDERAEHRTVRTDDSRIDADDDPVVIEARRQIIEHCLYGVDINPMAVEMAKLSLWLVSMDPQRPFTFLDDRLVAGDSLLGITSLEQLECMHIDPAEGTSMHPDLFDWSAGVRALVARAATHRRQIAEIQLGDDPLAALGRKREMLAAVTAETQRMTLVADLVVGAALASSRRTAGSSDPRAREEASRDKRLSRDGVFALAAKLANDLDLDPAAGEPVARDQRWTWLATDHVAGSFDRAPLHWPLAFPEVFEREATDQADFERDGSERDGFDAIVGNPPFLGGQRLTGALGTAYREYLVESIGRGVRGSADLVAYFVLRAHDLLNRSGQTGLIGTNTLAQGDTRQVGLDQIVANGATIRQAVKTRSWPSASAALEYCAVWTSRAPVSEQALRILDDVPVRAIAPSLGSESRARGNAHRLIANRGLSFQGSNILGLGFTMEPAEAAALIAKDPRNRDVLFPYLNGHDLNSRPDGSASRWVINFQDWNEERARTYADCYEQVALLVKPERAANKYSKAARERWWLFERVRPELHAAIATLDRVVVITLVSKTVMPAMVPTGQVFSHMLGVFATDDPAMLALLSSAPHYWWAASRASSMRADLRYTPSDVFETLALPTLTPRLRELGSRLDARRRDLMLSRQAGLTATYNLVFDEHCRDGDIVSLREIHRELDAEVCRAYGWDDLVALGLDHGFHKAGAYIRYTVGPRVQREILDRLLELNHQRHAEEIPAGGSGKMASGSRVADAQSSLF